MKFQNPLRNGQTRLMLLLILNTGLFAAVYFVLPTLLHFRYLPQIYLAAGVALALWFVVYNKGFTHRNVRPEDLPDTLTPEQKEAWIEEGKTRFARSRWALLIIIPILLTFLFDMLYLFVGQTVLGWFR